MNTCLGNVAVLAMVLGLLATPNVVAQTDTASAPTSLPSQSDIYGNARPRYYERRTLRQFATQAQRRAFRDFQLQGRRSNRRGGEQPFALPADRLRVRSGNRFRTRSIGAFGGSSLRQSFRRYGGFGVRSNRNEPADYGTLLARRQELIQATSLNAPVHRTMFNLGFPATLPTAIDQVPFVPKEGEENSEPTTSLYAHLQSGFDGLHRRSLDDAWQRFEDGDYRRAIRAFEAALVLERSDFESRIGLLFCHVSIGAMKTSIALLFELVRREPNPFVHNHLNITSFYGDQLRAREVRLQTRLFAQANDELAEAAGLYTFVLWYQGQREEAVQVAESLAASFPRSVFTDWPAKIAAAGSTPALKQHP